jgi:hypothetical protein
MPTQMVSAAMQPLANFHRPLTTKPRAVGVACPIGNRAPAKTTSGPSA